MTRSLPAGHTEAGERVPAALGMDDDALEAVEHVPPEASLVGRPPRQQVVRGQDERRALTEQPGVELRHREPLHVDDVGASGGKASETERMLEHLHRKPQRRALEQA